MTDFVPDFTVRSNLWDNETAIGKVRRRRHTIVIPLTDNPGKTRETTVTFCNNCGDGFCLGNVCAECGMEQADD